MKRPLITYILGTLVIALVIGGVLWAAPQRIPSSFVTIEEQDGNPSGRFRIAKFINGVLIDNGDGSVSIDWTAVINALSTALINNSGGYGLDCAGGVCDANEILYTDTGCHYINENLVKVGDKPAFYYFMAESQVIHAWCKVDTGSASINLENDDGTPADILSAELVCDVDGQTSCPSGCDVDTIQVSEQTIAAFDWVNLSISSVNDAPKPSMLSVCFGYIHTDQP